MARQSRRSSPRPEDNVSHFNDGAKVLRNQSPAVRENRFGCVCGKSPTRHFARLAGQLPRECPSWLQGPDLSGMTFCVCSQGTRSPKLKRIGGKTPSKLEAKGAKWARNVPQVCCTQLSALDNGFFVYSIVGARREKAVHMPVLRFVRVHLCTLLICHRTPRPTRRLQRCKLGYSSRTRGARYFHVSQSNVETRAVFLSLQTAALSLSSLMCV